MEIWIGSLRCLPATMSKFCNTHKHIGRVFRNTKFIVVQCSDILLSNDITSISKARVVEYLMWNTHNNTWLRWDWEEILSQWMAVGSEIIILRTGTIYAVVPRNGPTFHCFALSPLYRFSRQSRWAAWLLSSIAKALVWIAAEEVVVAQLLRNQMQQDHNSGSNDGRHRRSDPGGLLVVNLSGQAFKVGANCHQSQAVAKWSSLCERDGLI